jgi:hypothetical protein
MPHVATSVTDLLVIDDETVLRDSGIRDLAWTAAFTTDDATAERPSGSCGRRARPSAPSASIQDLYDARARGEVSGFTVPAINIRAQTFDMARTVFEAAAEPMSAR